MHMPSHSESPFLPPLVGIFLAIFDSSKGAIIVNDHPKGCSNLVSSDEDGNENHQDTKSLDNDNHHHLESSFSNLSISGDQEQTATLLDLASEWIIPRKALCGHLVTICLAHNKCLGEPQWIDDSSKYERGHFIFNLGFLFNRDAELAAYEPLVKKAARIFRRLEVSSSLLSSSPKDDVQMQEILQQMFYDLNTYSETSITLDSTNKLHLRLFPIYPNPQSVNDWDVPFLLYNIKDSVNPGWDITMARIIPFIDGVNTVKRIARLADVDYALTREAIQHLLYYSCITILDLFAYSNSYMLVDDEPLAVSLVTIANSDKRKHVKLRRYIERFVSTSGKPIGFGILLELYSKLRPGLSVNEWMEENSVNELGLDVRRMMVFGIIKGFLRRVFCYPVWLDHPSLSNVSANYSGHHHHHQPSAAPQTPMFSSPSDERTHYFNRQRSPLSTTSQVGESQTGTTTMTVGSSTITTTANATPHSAANTSKYYSYAHAASNISTPQTSSVATTRSIKNHNTNSEEVAQIRVPFPSTLPQLLNGEHHTDELCVRYKISLSRLEQVLAVIGGLNISSIKSSDRQKGDLGRVQLIWE